MATILTVFKISCLIICDTTAFLVSSLLAVHVVNNFIYVKADGYAFYWKIISLSVIARDRDVE
jgi:hypothetical protein